MAKKERSGFLGAAGKMWSIMQVIVNAVLELGGGDEDLHRLLTDGGKLAQQIAKLIVERTYKVVVDYNLSLAEMISAGNFTDVNNNISDKYFLIQGAGQHKVELVLVHLKATLDGALEHLNSLGLEPAKVEHSLAFGAACLEEEKGFLIIALGSVWVDEDGQSHYPCLYGEKHWRELRLYSGSVGAQCDVDCYFLALRK